MKQHFILFILFVCAISSGFSQSITPSVMPSNGGYFSNSSGSLSWTLGETATELLSSSTSKLSQGFQQPTYNLCSIIPSVPASITQTLVSNVCGARVYRFTAAVTTNAVGFNWTIPTSVGGVSGVTVDSGNISSSRIIKLKFVSNLSSVAGDSIWVNAFSSCGSSKGKAAKLANISMLPAVPSSITITKIDQLVCGTPRYRYTASTLALATATTTAATGYEWSFTGTLGALASVDSPLVTVTSPYNSIKITALFYSIAAAVTGDSVKVRFSSACGTTGWKAVKLTNTLGTINPPLTPASITQTLVSDACSARIYRYTAPTLPAGTTTNTAANGYTWTLPTGTLGSTGVLDSGSLSGAGSSIIRVKYSSNAGSATGDSIRLKYNSICGTSPVKPIKLVIPVSPPVAPASITQKLVSNVCGARVYRYTAPALPAGTSATGYNWVFKGSLFGTLNTNSFIDSGSLTAQALLVRYISNAAAVTGDSVKVQYNSACGYGAFKAAKLINVALSCFASTPVANTSLTKSTLDNTNFDISVFPNPSKGSFTMQLGDNEQYSIWIYDVLGILRKKYDGVSGKLIFGDELPSGNYLLKIKNNKNQWIKKIVKL